MSLIEQAHEMYEMSKERVIVRARELLVPRGIGYKQSFVPGTTVEGPYQSYWPSKEVQIVSAQREEGSRSNLGLAWITFKPSKYRASPFRQKRPMQFRYWDEPEECEQAWVEILNSWLETPPWVIRRESVFCRSCRPDEDFASCEMPDIVFLQYLQQLVILGECYGDWLLTNENPLDYKRPTRIKEHWAVLMATRRLDMYVERRFEQLAESLGVPRLDTKLTTPV